jgi:hypothetical protein
MGSMSRNVSLQSVEPNEHATNSDVESNSSEGLETFFLDVAKHTQATHLQSFYTDHLYEEDTLINNDNIETIIDNKVISSAI